MAFDTFDFDHPDKTQKSCCCDFVTVPSAQEFDNRTGCKFVLVAGSEPFCVAGSLFSLLFYWYCEIHARNRTLLITSLRLAKVFAEVSCDAIRMYLYVYIYIYFYYIKQNFDTTKRLNHRFRIQVIKSVSRTQSLPQIRVA